MSYLNPADVPGVQNAAELIAELEEYLALHHPYVADLPEEKLPRLQALLKPVIRRWADIGTGVIDTEQVGPFRRSKKDIGGHVLSGSEALSLRLLCGVEAQSVPAGLPRGSFPEPEPIDDLFMRRPGWPSVDRPRL